MKPYFVIFLISISTIQSVAQWQGTNPVYFNAGNVGIGTSNPSMKLDIATGDSQGIQLYHHNSGRWTRFFSSLSSGSYNGITGANDSGIIFGNDGGTVNNGFVIAPHQGASGLRMDQNGNVGIGTTNPVSTLDIRGRASINPGSSGISLNSVPWQSAIPLGYSYSYVGFNVQDNGGTGWDIKTDGGSNGGVVMLASIFGELKFVNIGSTGGVSKTLQPNDLLDNTVLSLKPGVVTIPGQTQMGTTQIPGGYKLSVDGKIISEEITVKLKGNWPDYVFENGYNLPSLDSIKNYIDQHKHLPDVPSAKEMEANGVNLGEMNMMLLKKIEELTLYMIELKEENREMKKLIYNTKKIKQ